MKTFKDLIKSRFQHAEDSSSGSGDSEESQSDDDVEEDGFESSEEDNDVFHDPLVDIPEHIQLS